MIYYNYVRKGFDLATFAILWKNLTSVRDWRINWWHLTWKCRARTFDMSVGGHAVAQQLHVLLHRLHLCHRRSDIRRHLLQHHQQKTKPKTLEVWMNKRQRSAGVNTRPGGVQQVDITEGMSSSFYTVCGEHLLANVCWALLWNKNVAASVKASEADGWSETSYVALFVWTEPFRVRFILDLHQPLPRP